MASRATIVARRALSSVSRHRPLMKLEGARPILANDTFVAPNAAVVGKVELRVSGAAVRRFSRAQERERERTQEQHTNQRVPRRRDESSVWFGAVVRGDHDVGVTLGATSNVQDRAVVATVPELESGFPAVVSIGDNVSVGAGATLRSCTIENNVLVGDGAVVLEGALVQANAVVLPGSVVPKGALIPSGQKWGGKPAAFVAALSEEEEGAIVAQAEAVAVRAAEAAGAYDPPPGAP